MASNTIHNPPAHAQTCATPQNRAFECIHGNDLGSECCAQFERELKAQVSAFGASGQSPSPDTVVIRREAVPEWASCETRGPYVRNGLKAKIMSLRDSERRARKAFTKPFMREPSTYFAEACAEAAAVFERHLAALTKEQRDET